MSPGFIFDPPETNEKLSKEMVKRAGVRYFYPFATKRKGFLVLQYFKEAGAFLYVQEDRFRIIGNSEKIRGGQIELVNPL